MASTRKALVVGPAFHNYNQSIAGALGRAGFETRIVDFPSANPPGLVNRLRIDLAEQLGVGRYKKAWNDDFNRRLLETYRAFDPELVLVIKGTWVDRTTLEAMARSVRAIWFQDKVYRCDRFDHNAKVCDYIFVFDGSDVVYLRDAYGVKAHFLPLAFDPETYHPVPGVAKDIDIFFVGFPYSHRRETFERLLADFPDRTFRIYGRYVRYKEPKTWLRYLKHQFDSHRRWVYVNREIAPAEVNRLYARSKIALNIHHQQSKQGCNPRVFEIMGSGAFQLVDANPYLREHLAQWICLYEGYDQLKALVGHYLDDDAAREAMAARSLAGSAMHTFDQRITELLRVCKI